jgi:hypothetical protein
MIPIPEKFSEDRTRMMDSTVTPIAQNQSHMVEV